MPRPLDAFDIPYRVFTHDDPVSVLIQVHLHLEAFIIQLITGALSHPDALDLDRLNFPSKVGLAAALGEMPEIAGPALRTINSLRNRIAHNLNASVEASDVEKLLKDMIAVIPGWTIDADDRHAPAHPIAFAACVLQAWLNGVVDLRGAGSLTREEIEARAVRRYPMAREIEQGSENS